MWQTISDLAIDIVLRASGVVELLFPSHRQRQVTIAIAIGLLALGIFMVSFISWADFFYA